MPEAILRSEIVEGDSPFKGKCRASDKRVAARLRTPSALNKTSLKRKPSPLWGRWAIRFANWSDEGILPQGNTHRPVAFGESPHPSRRLCCYAKWKHSAIRQPPLIGNLSAQASRHLPHKGEGIRTAKHFCPTLGDLSTRSAALHLVEMTAGGNGNAQTFLTNTMV